MIHPDKLLLSQGETSNLGATVYCHTVQEDFELPADAYLEGPFSSRGKTLTARHTFQQAAPPASGPVWQAYIPEPVMWTPRMPAYYELRGIPGVEKRIGLRELSIRKESFYREQQRWVARAAFSSLKKTHDEMDQWRESDLVPILTPEFIAFRDHSLKQGLPLIVDGTEGYSLDEYGRCSSLASIAMLLLSPAETISFVRFPLPTSGLLVGTKISEPIEIPDHVHFAAVSESLLRKGWQPNRRLPIVATRECDVQNHSPAELRAQCDQFQADLDNGAEYAGLWLLPKASS